MSNPTSVLPAPVFRATATSRLARSLCHSLNASPWASQRSLIEGSDTFRVWNNSMGSTGRAADAAGLMLENWNGIRCRLSIKRSLGQVAARPILHLQCEGGHGPHSYSRSRLV